MLRISLILLFIIIGHFASGQRNILEQRLTIQLRQVTAKQILDKISTETGIHFSYHSRILDSDKKIDFILMNESVEDAMELFSKYFPIEYTVVKKQIVLHQRKEDALQVGKNQYTISGIITDSLSGETLPGATVIIKNVRKGTTSNAYGFYSLTLPGESYELIFSYVGYEMKVVTVETHQDIRLDISLSTNNTLLAEVIVEKDENVNDLMQGNEGLLRVNPADLQLMPEFAGENGLIKSLQSLPGIQTHSDASSFFFVRGGNKDQNFILIDEAPVYNPSHLFGIYSVIIPDVAKEINIYKADLPISNTGRLSGLIDIVTRDGNMKDFNVEGNINPLMYRFSVESPLVKDKVSFFTSYRRSNFEWLYRRESENVNLFINDFNFKINWIANQNNRFYLSFFSGQDNYTESNESGNSNSGISWMNHTLTFRWNHIFSGKWFGNATLYTSNYEYNLFPGGEIPWQSGISDIGFKYDLSWYSSPDLTWRFGFSHVAHEINPGNLMGLDENVRQFVPEVFGGNPTNTIFYAQREKTLNDKWEWKAAASIPFWVQRGPLKIYPDTESGRAHQDTMIFNDDEIVSTYIRPDIRLSAGYKISDRTATRISWGLYQQNLHLLSNSVSPFSSFEVWMPSGKKIKPQQSRQISLSVNHQLSDQDIEFITSAYYKRLFNQIEYIDHAQLLMNPKIEHQLLFGNGRAYGIEVSLQRKKGKLQGWINYTWSRALKEFNEINEGGSFPAFYDRPHDLSVFVSWILSRQLIVSANWVYHTGSAFTTPVGFYEYNGSTIAAYGERNNNRLPDYHRLDLSLQWSIPWPKKHYDHSLTLGVYNFYNRHNAISVAFNKTLMDNGNIVLPSNLFSDHQLQTSMRYINGFIPSITYKFKIY